MKEAVFPATFRLFSCCLLILIGVLSSKASAQGNMPILLEPPNLDYQAICEQTGQAEIDLTHRDWTLWKEPTLDIDAPTAVAIARRYLAQSKSQEASPETAARILKVALDQYPAARRTLLYTLSRALIASATSEDDLIMAESYLLELHEQGHQRAAHALSEFYGDEGPAAFRDFDKSIEFLRLSALSGDRYGVVDYAQFVAGNPAFSDEEQRSAVSRALFTLIDRLREGDCRSLKIIGTFYHRGVLVDQDLDLALKWFERSAESGDYKVADFLAREFVSRRLNQMDLAKSMFYLKQAADGGLAAAQFDLAKAYIFGVTIEQDLALAEKYFLLAANQGSIFANHYLARLYSGEFGGAVEDEKARQYFEKSLSISTDAEALKVKFGLFLLNRGGQADRARAIDVLRKAAQSGSADAAYELGKIYLETGRADNRYWADAHDYFNAAALRGHSDSSARLAHMYSCGLGVDRSSQQSAYWLQNAAANGRNYSIYSVGRHLLTSSESADQRRGWTLIKQAAYKGSAPAIGYAISRWEKGVSGVATQAEDLQKLLTFTDNLADDAERNRIKVTIIKSRYEIAQSETERADLIAALDPLIQAGSLEAMRTKAQLMLDAGSADLNDVRAIYERLAAFGDARAKRELAALIRRDFAQDVSIATALLQQSAAAGDVKAKMRLIDPASPSAMEALDEIALSGLICSVDKMVELARLYATLPNAEAAPKARKWLSLAAQITPQDAGDKQTLAAAFRDGIAGIDARYKAEGYLLELASLGQTSALRDLADGHMTAMWQHSAPEKAKDYYLQLINLGALDAANRLLRHIADGLIDATTDEVATLVDQIGPNMHDLANDMFKLAQLNLSGALGEVDDQLALNWLNASAEGGEPRSMYHLFQKYHYGVGTAADPVLAADWLQKSAELGHAKAARDLSVAYQMGLGSIKPNSELKEYWLDQYKILSQ